MVRPPGFEPGLQARGASSTTSGNIYRTLPATATFFPANLLNLAVVREAVRAAMEPLVEELHRELAETFRALAEAFGPGCRPPEGRPVEEPAGPGEPLDPRELLGRLDEFRAYLAGELELEDLTVEGYSGIIRKFLRWAGDRPVTRRLIREYKLTLREAAKATRANFVKAARRFFRDFLGRPDLVEGMRMPRETALERAKKHLSIGATKEELRRFYEALLTDEGRAIFMLLLKSGLRVHEVLGLRFCDVDFERRMINPAEGSATKRTWVTFYDTEAAQALEKWLKIRGEPKSPEERIFKMKTRIGIEKQFRKASEKTGIKLKPKDLRVIFAKLSLIHISEPTRPY